MSSALVAAYKKAPIILWVEDYTTRAYLQAVWHNDSKIHMLDAGGWPNVAAVVNDARRQGITHVFGASAFFLRDAESQHYRPRYAYLPALGAFGAANSPPEQMNGAMTVGWAPTIDVNQEQDPGDTAGAAHCRAVMRAAGLTATNRQDQKLMYAVCDALYSFRAALTASQAPSVPGLRRGYEALGGSFKGAQTFASLLAPNHHYGVDSVRDVAYDTACTCLKYTSKTNRS